MALSSSTLSTLMRAAIIADKAAIGAIDGSALTALCDAISDAVVEHVVEDGVITVSTTTTCPAGAGTGTDIAGTIA